VRSDDAESAIDIFKNLRDSVGAIPPSLIRAAEELRAVAPDLFSDAQYRSHRSRRALTFVARSRARGRTVIMTPEALEGIDLTRRLAVSAWLVHIQQKYIFTYIYYRLALI
jgi:ABC-type antimicrobial peptide transport system ATPase subunit